MDMIPTFSLCHATARVPDGWRNVYEYWKAFCDNWSDVEYILAVDTVDKPKWPNVEGTGIILTENTGRQCCVDAINQAGKVSQGKFIITTSDDMYCPPHWDTELLKVIPDLDKECVVEVKTGTTPADWEEYRWLLYVMETRAYYNRYGYIIHPEFTGMYGDVWFTENARRDGVVIDARHLTFQHKHWIGTNVPYDDIYKRQNERGEYEKGEQIIGRLRAERDSKCK
jgi:hypothetical protein